MESNYRAMRNARGQAHWKRLHEKGFEHFEISNEGKVRNGRTGVPCTLQGNRYNARLYAVLTPNKESGIRRPRSFPVDVLVYETHHNCVLPPRYVPEHINKDLTDNRLVNLRVDERIHVASVPVTKHIELTVKPAAAPQIVQKPVEVDRTAELAKRYEARMDELHLALLACDEWRTADDILRIGIMESEWLYLLDERLTAEEVRELVLKLIRLLSEKGG